MKKFIIFISIAAMLPMFFSCQNRGTESTQKEAFQQAPNPSDIHFGEAVKAFQAGKMEQAATALTSGISELKKEAAKTAFSEETRAKEEAAIAALEKMVPPIREGKINDLHIVQEAIINADASVKHEYLVTTDEFVLAKPKTVRSKKINRAFDRSLKLLKSFRGDLDKDLQGQADALIKESEGLEQKRAELDAVIFDEMKKLQGFIKQHRPEKEPVTYYPYM